MTFTFKLSSQAGHPPTRPRSRLGVYVWHRGDTIALGADRSLRVVDVRDHGRLPRGTCSGMTP